MKNTNAERDTNQEPRNLAEALMAEIRRVRDEVLPAYLEIGPAGAFAVAGMRGDLDAATRALAEQDAVSCLRLLGELQGWHT